MCLPQQVLDFSLPSTFIHTNTGRHDDDLLEPLQEDILTFDDAQPTWEWDATSGKYVEGPLEWLLFGGPLSAPLPTPVGIKGKVDDPLACPSGGTKLELTWDEEDDTWLEDFDDTSNEILSPFDHKSEKDIFPARHSWRDNDTIKHRNWDCAPIVPSFCPLIGLKETEVTKHRRVSFRSPSVKAY